MILLQQKSCGVCLKLFTSPSIISTPRLRLVPLSTCSRASSDILGLIERTSGFANDATANWVVRIDGDADCVVPIGYIQYSYGSGYVGVFIQVEYRFQGYATEACKSLLKCIFSQSRHWQCGNIDSRPEADSLVLQGDRVFMNVQDGDAVVRLAEKLGLSICQGVDALCSGTPCEVWSITRERFNDLWLDDDENNLNFVISFW